MGAHIDVNVHCIAVIFGYCRVFVVIVLVCKCQSQTRLRQPVSPGKRLCVTIRYLAQKSAFEMYAVNEHVFTRGVLNYG